MSNDRKSKRNPMTEKDSGLSSAQEVTYQSDFKKADAATKNPKKK